MPAPPKYRGVFRKNDKKRRKPWYVKIRTGDRKQKVIGYYADPEYAARVYDAIEVELRGIHNAVLNFDGFPPADMCRLDIIRLLQAKGLR